MVSEPEKLKKEIKKLKDDLEKFQKIFELAPDPMYLIDIKGSLVDGNKAAEEFIGYKREEFLGKNLLKGLLPPRDVPKVLKLVIQGILGKKMIKSVEVALNRKDGSQVQVEISGAPVKFGNQIVLIGIARDITERKRVGNELRDKNEELEKFHKLAVGREVKMIELKDRIRELEK
jgi:PAS domain S-box-containing protein